MSKGFQKLSVTGRLVNTLVALLLIAYIVGELDS